MKYWSLLTYLLFAVYCTAVAQQINDKVQFKGTDGKTYNGQITVINNGQYKVKYDGYDFSAWMVKEQFQVVPQNVGADEAMISHKWQVGDKVQIQDYYNNNTWENATVTIVHYDWTPVRYKALFDEPGSHAITELLLTPEQIRSRNTVAKTFALNSPVDAYYASGSPKARATVIEAKGNGRYKVHYDGCGSYRDEEVDWSQLKSASTISSTHPDITAVFGKWAMFVYSYPTTVIKGNDVYREYGTGAKAPPLQINANGTYVWYDEYNKPPVKGIWATHAKIEGLTMGTEAVNGIILKDSHGVLWKIYKDRADHIEARTMCSGMTQGGSKIK